VKRTLGRLVALLVLVFIPRIVTAQVTPAAGAPGQNDAQDPIRVGAVIFYDFTYTKSPKSTDAFGNTFSPTTFNVARTYINIQGNISHIVSFRITPDITRDTTTANATFGSLVFRIKYGFAQFSLDQWTNKFNNNFVRVGIQQTPYIDAQEAVYRYRFQGTVFLERDGSLPSADAGLTWHSNLPNGYGDFHLGVYNGEGYSRQEVNGQKAFQARGTVRPLPMGSEYLKGLRISGFVDRDSYFPNAPRNKALFGLWYEHRFVNAGFDYLSQTDQLTPAVAKVDSGGWSIFATPIFKEKGNGPEALIRYDSFKPNKSDATKDQTRQRTIVGFAYWFPHPGGNATAALLFDYERVKFDGFPATSATATQQRYTLHGLINF